MKKKSIACLVALLTLAMLLCAMPLAVGAAEGEEMTDSKRVILEYTDQPIDVSLLFDAQPDGAVYTVAEGTGAGTLEGSMFTVTTPGSFRVVQTVGDTEIWIALGVQVTLTVTVKDQILPLTALPSSTLDDVISIEGLLAGHTATGVTLTFEAGESVGAHDMIKAMGVTVVNGDGEDVSSCYNVKSVNGKWHSYSFEWLTDAESHTRICSAYDCDVKVGNEAHSYDNACDASCDVCLRSREVPDHVWSEYQVVLEATTETEGEQFRVCLACGEVEFAVIPVVKEAPVFLIVCLVVACAVAFGSVAFLVVRNVRKKAAALAALAALEPAEAKAEEKAEEKTEE